MKYASAFVLMLGAPLLLSVVAFGATTGAPIASVVDVVKEAFHTPPGGTEATAAVGDQLLPDEVLRTATDSAIEITFPDGATLRLEADSDLILDSYVFDPSALKSAAAITVPAGVARYTTGGVSTDDTGVAFLTPVATVGIRGTDVVISVGKGGETVVDVLAGKASAKANSNSAVAEAEEGQSIFIQDANQDPKVGSIGDFATAAGAATATQAGGSVAQTRQRDVSTKGTPQKSNDPPAGGNNTGGGGTGSGGGDTGGEPSNGDGDGNAGHGDNDGKHDNDNPGKSGDKSGSGG